MMKMKKIERYRQVFSGDIINLKTNKPEFLLSYCIVDEKALTEQEAYIEQLEADNPQVECIECRGYGFIVSKIFKVREQDLIIKELQAQLAEANERIDAWREEL
jgi:hypothetical protein